MQKEENSSKIKNTTIPRYAQKYKSLLEQSSSKKPQPPSVQQLPHMHKDKQFFFYRIKSIGVGAHSFVYLVQQQQSHSLFAEKSITLQHSKQVMQDLMREIKILAFANHQNIVKLYHFYRTSTHFNIVLEYAEDSLFALKQKFRIFKQKEILEVIRQLLRGLHYLHSRGIVHADVKLENIMIANGTVKLCDFGYAHRCNSSEAHAEIVGTLEYLPPEYVNGLDSGVKRDIWAIGILAFEMLVGKTPFENLKQQQKWSKLVKNNPQSFQQQLISQSRSAGRHHETLERFTQSIFCEWSQRKSAGELLQTFFKEQEI